MSDTFTEYLRRKAAKYEEQSSANRAVIEEWRQFLSGLFSRIKGWLDESDPDHIITVSVKDDDVTEPGLGRYEVPRMDLKAVGKWIGIIPKARNTVVSAHPPQKQAPERATGRVDITDEVRRYVLYRLPGDGGEDVWMIDDLRSDPRPLDRQAFEKALMSYL